LRRCSATDADFRLRHHRSRGAGRSDASGWGSADAAAISGEFQNGGGPPMKSAIAWARTIAIDKTTVTDYLELTKPSVTSLILMSTQVGFFMAVHGAWNFVLLMNTLIGTALVAASAAAAHHYLEIDSDAKMRRTEMRPLPTGRLHPNSALTFSLTLAAAGTIYLLLAVNVLTCALGALTWASYLFLYTPMKRRTTYCTFVGAFPGALPILMGWTAARGTLDVGGWVLCAIL